MSWHPARRLRRFALALLLLLACAGPVAAATLTIDAGDDPDARLELRRTTLPSGAEVEVVVLTGERITLTIDDLTIVGQRIELDVTGRLVRVVGPGSFASGEERVEGSDLELSLDDERLWAIDVIVFTSAIDVRGDIAERLPGQLTFLDGLASPCSRCGQEVLDYAFRAERMVLYPGDRLVGYDVAVLIRGVTVLRLPLIVVPLAQGDRQPHFGIRSGTATERAEVALRWPYVAGPNALGTFTVRYLADVDPSAGGGLVGRLLGGAVERSAWGFELDHRLYDEVGSGQLYVALEPRRAAREASPGVPARPARDDRWTVRLGYVSDAGEFAPSVRFDAQRDDARTAGRWTYELALAALDPALLGGVGVRFRFDTQGFLDTDPTGAPFAPPPYADRRTPLRTALRLRFEPIDLTPVQLGRLRVSAAAADLGLFQDLPNPINRRAAAAGIVSEGRALVGHQVVLDPWTPWPGVRIDGDNRFEGRYYALGERAVSWRTRLGVVQALGELGSLSLTWTRDVEEGETPFRFDAVPARTRTDAQARLTLRIAPWASLAADGGYVFVETRRPETVGWAPLTSRLTLFADQPWIDASVEHRWLILEEDPGILRAVVSLQHTRSPVQLRLSVDHTEDLQVPPGDPAVSETVTRVTGRAAVERAVALDVTTAYRPAPAPDADGRVRTIEPLDVRLALGSLQAGDLRPGAAIQALVDVEASRLERLTVDLRGRYGPVVLEARQRIDLPLGTISDARISLAWDDVARLEVRGVMWLAPAWLGLPYEPRVRELSVQLRELRPRASPRWEVAWRTTLDPALGDGGGRRDSRLEIRVALLQEDLGPWRVSVEGLADWALPDDLQDELYLRRASLVLGADAWERIGVQGRLSYQASYNRTAGELARSELTIDALTLAVRPTDELLLGARLSDVWEFTGRDARRSPWSVQPEVFFLWDRCCWALSGAWNSATGSVRLVLTGPGASTGLEQVLDTGLTIPRAGLRDPLGSP